LELFDHGFCFWPSFEKERSYIYRTPLAAAVQDQNIRISVMFIAWWRQLFTGADVSQTSWTNVTCPGGKNSDNNDNTCVGHLTP
jgi:hypothetical protein